MSGTCAHVTLHGKRDFADVPKDTDSEMADDPGLSKCAQSDIWVLKSRGPFPEGSET